MRKFNTVGGGARTNVNGLEFEARTHLYEAIEKHPDFIVDGNEIKKNNITVAYYYEKNSLYKKLLEVKIKKVENRKPFILSPKTMCLCGF